MCRSYSPEEQMKTFYPSYPGPGATLCLKMQNGSSGIARLRD